MNLFREKGRKPRFAWVEQGCKIWGSVGWVERTKLPVKRLDFDRKRL